MTGHGGNIYSFSSEYGILERDIIDFSASINPLGIPMTVRAVIKKNINRLCHYPDPEAGKLRMELSRHLQINPESIICGNGSTELIYLIAKALRPQNVLIPVPAFSEYERACKISCKSQITSYKLRKEDNFDVDADEFIKVLSGKKKLPLVTRYSSHPFNMAFICNPNNPTGRLIRKDDILKIADAARQMKCYLVIDEAFIDFIPHHSVIREVEKNPYLIVLRSMTKFYALSGLRLGYMICPLNIARLIKKYKEPWTVNTMAQNAGIAAINDKKYRDRTFNVVAKEKQFMERWFKKMKIDFLPSFANYYLLRMDNAHEADEALQGKGIMVRDCSNFKGLDKTYIRVAVKSRRDNKKLLQELANICGA